MAVSGDYRSIPGYSRYSVPDIGPVPGVGPILGVWHWVDIVMVVRSDGEVPVLYAAGEFSWKKVRPIWDEVLP